MLLNGVRSAATAPGRCDSGCERGPAKGVSLRERIEMVSDPRNLDESVEEVFQLMLGLICQRAETTAERGTESVTAVVGFGGLLTGACIFSSDGVAALRMAGQMTGTELQEIDDTVKDAVGEICNMLAGAWKGKVPELAANCGLSVPAVITGGDYRLHVQAPEFQLHHRYRCGETAFEVRIVCDGLQ